MGNQIKTAKQHKYTYTRITKIKNDRNTKY